MEDKTIPLVQTSEERLLRAVGLKEIIALTINGIIGAGIFRLPADAARILGIASPIAFLIAGLFTIVIVLCFAELGGKYDRTGGAYLYASEAFGGPVAFLIGWMYFLARLTSLAALSGALIGFLGYFSPLQPWQQRLLIGFIMTALALINYRGIRLGSRVINFLTLAKLIPLLIFILAGLALMNRQAFSGVGSLALKPLSQTVMLLMFAFSGFEVIAVPGAEIINAKRTLPLGLLIGTGATILVYVLIQAVAVASNPAIASSQAPLGDAAQILLGRSGGILLNLGAVCSILGTLTGLFLVAPRILYAMAVNDQLPPLLLRLHPRYRTPHFSILLYGSLALPLALGRTFTTLVTLSVMARLITYIGSAIALLVLRKKNPSPDTFRVPGGPLFPALTILLSLLLLTATNRTHWISAAIALAAGLLLYLATAQKRHAGSQ